VPEDKDYVDDLEKIISKLIKAGLIAPSPEYIPTFKEMAKLMQKALELSLNCKLN
jgi:hypothetical protein